MANKRRRSRKTTPKPCAICGRPPHEMKRDYVAIREWLADMERFVDRGTALSEAIDGEAFNENSHEFWALVKYVENVQECIVQLDGMNCTIVRVLEEIPLKSERYADLTWDGMKRMRNILAHRFRDIDKEILWSTVTEEFPVLKQMLSVLVVAEEGPTGSGRLAFRSPARMVKNLPLFQPAETLSPGSRLIGLFFDDNDVAQCLRIGVVDDRTLAIEPSETLEGMDLSVNRIQGEEREEIGHLSNLTFPAEDQG